MTEDKITHEDTCGVFVIVACKVLNPRFAKITYLKCSYFIYNHKDHFWRLFALQNACCYSFLIITYSLKFAYNSCSQYRILSYKLFVGIKSFDSPIFKDHSCGTKIEDLDLSLEVFRLLLVLMKIEYHSPLKNLNGNTRSLVILV